MIASLSSGGSTVLSRLFPPSRSRLNQWLHMALGGVEGGDLANVFDPADSVVDGLDDSQAMIGAEHTGTGDADSVLGSVGLDLVEVFVAAANPPH